MDLRDIESYRLSHEISYRPSPEKEDDERRRCMEFLENGDDLAKLCLQSFDSCSPESESIWRERFPESKVIAKGGFATIVEADDIDGKKFIFKVLNDDRNVSSLFHEFCVGLHVSSSPCFCKFYGIGRNFDLCLELSSPRYFIVMEKIEGNTLANEELTPKEYLECTLSICKALEEANITHYDMHDDNVLIQREKGGIKIIDFGYSYYETSEGGYGYASSYDMGEYGILQRHNRLTDAYKLLVHGLARERRDEYTELFTTLIRFFHPNNNIDDVVEEFWYGGFWGSSDFPFYPPSALKFSDYIALLEKLL
jgi:serine/threonine protein kinase